MTSDSSTIRSLPEARSKVGTSFASARWQSARISANRSGDFPQKLGLLRQEQTGSLRMQCWTRLVLEEKHWWPGPFVFGKVTGIVLVGYNSLLFYRRGLLRRSAMASAKNSWISSGLTALPSATMASRCSFNWSFNWSIFLIQYKACSRGALLSSAFKPTKKLRIVVCFYMLTLVKWFFGFFVFFRIINGFFGQ